MVRIRNNQTGEVKEVDPSQLSQYGLSAPPTNTQTQQAPTIQPQQTTTQDTTPKYITGHSLEDHAMALSKAKAAGDTGAIKSINDEITRELAYQKDVNSGAFKTAAQKDQEKTAQAKKQQTEEASSLIGATLQNYLDVPSNQKGIANPRRAPLLDRILAPEAREYESGVKGEAPALGKVFGGTGSGLRITQAEINSWTNLLPSVKKNDRENAADVKKLNTILEGRFGKGNGIDPTIMKQFQTGQGNTGDGINFGGDAKNILNGILGMPKTVLDTAKGEVAKGNVTGTGILGKILLDQGVGYAKNLNKDLGSPLEGGDVAGRAAQNLKERPISTALDALPFLKIGKFSGASKATKVADTADTMGSKASLLQRGVTGAADSINGGGSKEYLARQATKGALPQNQVLMEENILTHPTEAGRIKATAQSIDKYGSQLAETYKKSDRHFTGDNLNKTLESKLTEAGYDPKGIKFIKSYISKQGNFDLAKNDSIITAETAWRTAQKLEKNPPKIVGTPESMQALKKLSLDSARIIRQELGDKVPETKPINARYSALRDYFDNRLSEPGGVEGSPHKGGITETAIQGAKNMTNPLLNVIYKGAKPNKLIRDMRKNATTPGAFRPATQ